MVEKEETIEQRPPEAEAEPMVISGANTPVAPDDAELDIKEEELLMDETRLQMFRNSKDEARWSRTFRS